MWPILYRDFSIVLPRNWSSVMFLEALLECDAEGLKYTKSVTVSMQHDQLGAPSYAHDEDNDDGLYFNSHGDWEDKEDELGQKHFQPRVLNALVRLLINKIPIERLETFWWVADLPSTV